MKTVTHLFVVATAFATQVKAAPYDSAVAADSVVTTLFSKRAGCDIQLGVTYDDSQGNIGTVWTGSWTHLTNQGNKYMAQSFSYTSQANAKVQLYDPFPAGQTHLANVTVWSSKKNDRGKFSVYIGTTLLVSVLTPIYYLFQLMTVYPCRL